MSVNADAAPTTLRSNPSSASTPSSTSPTSITPPPPIPSWQCTIRKLLRNVSQTVLTDEQLSDLHISFEEEDESSIRPSTETSSAIDAYFATSEYQSFAQYLSPNSCSQRTMSYFARWVEDLAHQQSENRVGFQRKLSRLCITGDTRTKGVKPFLIARDMENGHSISVIDRNRRRNEWQLSSTELYTLLGLADEQRLARPFENSYQVHTMVIHSHWVQRLSVQIPSSFLSSMIDGAYDLLGNVNIHRSPWFNFVEQEGQRGALRAIFEHFPLKTTSTLPLFPAVLIWKHKIEWDAILAMEDPRSRGRSLHQVDPRTRKGKRWINSRYKRRRIMPGQKVGDEALSGEWEQIASYAFDITEDMTIEFEGESCYIKDGENNLVEKLGREHGLVTREVLPGYVCYVLTAWVRFEKKSL